MKRGNIDFIGKVKDAINRYMEVEKDIGPEKLEERKDRDGSGEIIFTKINLVKCNKEIDSIAVGDSFNIVFEYKIIASHYDFSHCHIGINVYNSSGVLVFYHNNLLINRPFSQEEFLFNNQLILNIKDFPFKPDTYYISCDITDNNRYLDAIHDALNFQVYEGNIYNYYKPLISGISAVNADWRITSSSSILIHE